MNKKEYNFVCRKENESISEEWGEWKLYFFC